MTKITFLLCLLALIVVATAFRRNVMQHREKRDAVLIRSKRRWVLSTIDIEENMEGPFPFKVTQMFNDKDTEHKIKFLIKGEGVTIEPFGLFTMDTITGDVFIHRAVDREVKQVYHLDFDVLDWNTGDVVDKTLSFNVEIHDKNDNPPKFSVSTVHGVFPENAKDGTVLATLQAHDNDLQNTPNSKFNMTLASQEPALPKIVLQTLTSSTSLYQLSLKGCFDYDKAKNYKVLVTAQDQGTPSLTSTATVTLDIGDSNTHPPIFTAAKYNTEVMEMEFNKEILRLGVTDKDTPNTPASRAVFTILKGNEGANYKIETDPKTNEGVLYVIKGKNFEKTEITVLEISVKNEEKLFKCVDGRPVTDFNPPPNTVKVEVKVIDVNDPPVFKKDVEFIYRPENTSPGDLLFTPEVKDEDTDVANIRYELVSETDPAKWVTVDPKSGKITTVKKMDRESTHVINDTYTVVIHAIDDGVPQGRGTCTVVIYLGDLNDNAPYLLTKTAVLCGNTVDRVNLETADIDKPPFAGPFSFSLMEEKELKDLWKFDPTTGHSTSLISLKRLPHGNYSIPLKIQDQQGLAAEEVFNVVVCDCEGENVCRGRQGWSSRLDSLGIGLIFTGILLLALLLLCCLRCENRNKTFQLIPLNLQDEGNQTLIKYNEEGGGSVNKPEPFTAGNAGGMKIALAPAEHMIDGFRKSERGSVRSPIRYSSKRFYEVYNDGDVMSIPHHSRSMVRTNTVRSGVSQLSRSYSSRSDKNLADHIDRRLFGLPEDLSDYPESLPCQYECEGNESDCESLAVSQLTDSNLGDNLDFLQDLGPKFNTLGGICQQSMTSKNVRL
ncbi:cadherin-like protein 26 [Triplophysa dalaica]|uniref:cadherin-like protein 26 n=1 Tax=Triplophysa dalaica TaxID=1582913 RepID=UPI0024E00168|nr:cadherin-like protein 26 [Triplophysa dalaica]